MLCLFHALPKQSIKSGKAEGRGRQITKIYGQGRAKKGKEGKGKQEVRQGG